MSSPSTPDAVSADRSPQAPALSAKPAPVVPRATWVDKVEAFISRLSTRDNFWHSICSFIWLPLAFFLISVAHAAIRVARSTYIVDMAEGDLRTRYVSVANTLMGIILLLVGALTSVLAMLGTLWALGALAALGLIGAFMAGRLPEVSRRD